VIAQVSGRIAAKHADRVVVHTAGGVGYEIVVPLGVMETLPAVGEPVSLATELVVREDGWALYGFRADGERHFFQRLIGVTGVGPKIAIALMSALGLERGVRAVTERNIGLLSSVSGIGKKTAERLVLELADKLGEFQDAVVVAPSPSDDMAAARKALERLGYGTVEAERVLRQVLASDGGGTGGGAGNGDTATLVRRALQLLQHG
jgi:holliday junction DNA helicase RuvA